MKKEAFKEESGWFVEWCLMRDKKISENDMIRVVERMGFELMESTPSRKKGGLEVGEDVIVDANKNTNELNVDACDMYDRKEGVVVEATSESLVIEFGRRKVRFDGNKSGKSTGLYRHSPGATAPTGKSSVEVVYLKDTSAKPPNKTQREDIAAYVEKGMQKGEKRYTIYYQGLVRFMAKNKKGQAYVTISTNQRPYPTAINPVKGQVLYIGLLGSRPGGWKNQYKQWVAESLKEEA